MKKLIIPAFIGLMAWSSCSPTSDTGGQGLKSNGQSFDSSTNAGTSNDQMTRTPSEAIQQGEQTTGGMEQDSQKYKGNNSDTIKKPR